MRRLPENEKTSKENIEDVLGLTPMQEGLLFHYLEAPESNYYFEQLILDISGPIDHRYFEGAWNRVIHRNEMLRTAFRWERVNQPVQLIFKKSPLRLRAFDLSDKTLKKRNRLMEEIAAGDRLEGFDLRDVPFRVTLVNLGEENHRVLISSHHILYDGWSSALILEEFFRTYGNMNKTRVEESPPKAGFKDYLKWLLKRDTGKRGGVDYWKEYLKGIQGKTELSIKAKTAETGGAGSYHIKLHRESLALIGDFLKLHFLTLAGLFYTAWGILLQGYNNTGDVILGTTVSGRSAAISGIERTVGLFINTLPLRVRTGDEKSCLDLLRRVNDELRVRREYETTPLVKIREYSELSPGEKLFDTLLVMENYPFDSERIQSGSGLEITSYAMTERTHYDLTVTIDTFNGIEINFGYKRCFEDGAVVRLAHHFETVLFHILRNPGGLLTAVDILSAEERRLILDTFNDTDSFFPGDKTIHRLFEEQASRTPDHIALTGPMGALSYNEFDKKSDLSARHLGQKGIGPGTITAIMANRSIETVIVIMAVLKAGGAYLPIDPGYPQERIDYILKDSNAKIHITSCRDAIYRARIDRTGIDHTGIDRGRDKSRPYRNRSQNAAYIIYTSGSTGRPKGVMVEHRSLVNRLTWMQKSYPLSRGDVILHKTPVTFDISVWELFWWGIAGASVCILSPGAEKDPAVIVETVERNRITVKHFVPSMLQSMLQYIETEGAAVRLRGLRRVFSSGEALSPPQVKRFNRLLYEPYGTRLTNLYGPTEATIDVSRYDCFGRGHVHGEIIPIGRPIDNIKLVILDRFRRLVPVGVPGELNISGAGLARGYINNPGLTNSKFQIPNNKSQRRFNVSRDTRPPYPLPLTPLYSSGDRACWLDDGNIRFLGRFDDQIKIRGFRVEPIEIENQLLTHPQVKEVVVAARETPDGESGICAYIVSDSPVFTVCELKDYVSQRLPYYMVPSYFIPLEQLPLTPNGKIDRKSLPQPGGFRPPLKVSFAGPGNDLEKKVAVLWKEILKLETVGIFDNFFDLGGHSLHLIRLTSRLKELFNKEIPVTTLFRCPTIRMLVAHLKEEVGIESFDNDGKPSPDSENPAAGSGGRDVAVIGMALRFPGAKTVDEFWENLKNGVESITFFSSRRLEEAGVDPLLIADPRYVRAKGCLEDRFSFDADFFEYTPRDAGLMDPQLRLLHECTWGALEHAGYDSSGYDGFIGLYVGALSNHFWSGRLSHLVKDHSRRLAVGSLTDRDFFSTRIAYKLNLKGPALTLQTACSTSLVAIDAACRGLLSGDCHIALAGGVSITHEDEHGYLYQEGMVRSSDGHCRAFDAGAGGTVGGNGVGIVVLKRLERAAADRDFIYAVIKGSAVNNDGLRKVGYTAPSVEGQAEVILAAQCRAGVSAGSISYVEAHGTGTALGDPVEIEALTDAFAGGKKGYCAVGSVKSNIGHLDAASGVAGFIKTVLALRYRLIPPSLHYNRPNSSIDFDNSPFYINTRLLPWKVDGFPLRAGVSSFGIGGTNAHVILEEAPNRTNCGVPLKKYVFILSAKTKVALETKTGNLSDYLKKNRHVDPGDVAYTLQVGRRAFEHRRLAVVSGVDETVDVLSNPVLPHVETFYTKDHHRSVVFMFPGQGSQYIGMGWGLYQQEPVFREEMDRCFKILGPLMTDNIKDILYHRSDKSHKTNKSYSGKLNRTDITQPVLFIFEYALARLLMEWGITPNAMIGHSIGEYVAACISGVFTLEEGLHLVVRRGKLMGRMPAGGMLTVSLPREELGRFLNKKISLAAVNGISSCVVSGPREDIRQLNVTLGQLGIENRVLHTSHAFHSPMMDPILEEFRSVVGRVELKAPQIPYISNVTGSWIRTEDVMDPGYWSAQTRKTVRFFDGLTRLFKEERALFIEVGPGRVLSTFARKHPGKKPSREIVNLVGHPNEDIDDIRFLLTRIGRMWGAGLKIDWNRFNARREHSRIPLPTYPFAGRSYMPAEKPPAPVPPGEETGGRKDIADWFYIPLWRQSPGSAQSGEKTPCFTWLVFIGRGRFGRRLVRRLKKGGHTVFEVKRGDVDYETLLKDMTKITGDSPLKILHLWGLTPSHKKRGTDHGIESVESDLESGLYSLLDLARAVGDAGIAGPVHIEAVTNDMLPVVGDEDLRPGKAALLGPLKIIPLEYPNTRCRCIDIHLPGSRSVSEERLIENIVLELGRNPEQPETAFRGNNRWVREFEPLRIEKSPDPHPHLRPRGVYLITGGFGGMGFTLARTLARGFRARLILVGRSPLTPGGAWEEKVADLEKSGADVLTFSCDVSDPGGMTRVLQRAVRRFGHVDGVFHTAGVADYAGVIQRRTRRQTRDVLAPKIQGTLVLDKVLQGHNPDFIVLFSSIGNIAYQQKFGQTAYAAANEFLDVFSYYKTGRGRTRVFSINWSDWRETGMAVEAASHWVKTLGLKETPHKLLEDALLPSEGVDVLLRILNSGLPRVVVSPESLTAKIKKSGDFLDALRNPSPGDPKPSGDRKIHGPGIQEAIASVWRNFLGVDSVGIHDNFFDLGASSLDIVQVKSRLLEVLDIDIPIVTLYTYPTVHSLARHLENRENREGEIAASGRINEQIKGWDNARKTMNQNLNKFRKDRKPRTPRTPGKGKQ